MKIVDISVQILLLVSQSSDSHNFFISVTVPVGKKLVSCAAK